MRNRRFIFASVPFYVLAAVSIAAYMLADIFPRITLSPAGRLVLLGIFCVCTYIGSRIVCKTPAISKKKTMKITFFIFFMVYVSLLLTFTLFDPMFGRSGHRSFILSDRMLLQNYLANSCNIIPFATIFAYIKALASQSMNFSIIATNLLGNLAALTPMALFLPIFIRKCAKWKYFVLTAAAAVAVIELLQLIFVTGSCDIDDLILNVSGACAAFGLLKIKPIKRVVDTLLLRDVQE